MGEDDLQARRQETGLLWWEKTVEYAFVRHCLPDATVAIPFAGASEEAYGDLMLKDGGQFRLVEFKLSAEEIQRERYKFDRMRGSAAQRAERSFHALLLTHYPELCDDEASRAHWFIVGAYMQRGIEEAKLELHAYPYTRSENAPATLSDPAALGALPSVTYPVLAKYLDKLELVRSAGGIARGGSVLAGVSGAGTVLLSVEDFRQMSPSPAPTDNPEAAHVLRPSTR